MPGLSTFSFSDRTCLPQFFGYGEWCHLQIGPPGPFVAVPMQILVVGPAKRDGEFVADFEPQRAWLGELEVVSVRRGSLANQAGLLAYKVQVGLVPPADLLGQDRARVGPSRFFLGRRRGRLSRLRRKLSFCYLFKQIVYGTTDRTIDRHVSDRHPDKLEELKSLWFSEAGRYLARVYFVLTPPPQLVAT